MPCVEQRRQLGLGDDLVDWAEYSATESPSAAGADSAKQTEITASVPVNACARMVIWSR
jgi:hypothetical protein